MSEPRRHVVHVTSDAVRWMIGQYGFDGTCERVKQMVKDAGLAVFGSTWRSGMGKGITIIGYTTQHHQTETQ